MQKLLQKLPLLGVDCFIIPSQDEFMNEYIPDSEKRLEYITGFTGSNGVAVIGTHKSAFFTDGRYILQAKKEVSMEVYDIKNLCEFVDNNYGIIGLDPKLHTKKAIEQFHKYKLLDNPIDDIWIEKPLPPKSQIFPHPIEYAGEDSVSKRKRVMEKAGNTIILTAPDSICWLLNIRGSDVKYSPLVLAYAILYKDCTCDLFIDSDRIDFDIPSVNIKNPDELEVSLRQLNTACIDVNKSNYWIYNQVNNPINTPDPCQYMKAIKNGVEIKGAIKAHEIDAIAVNKFIDWVHEGVDEISAANKLLEFRMEHPDFLYPSFETISAFGENAAIIHYHANESSNKTLRNGLYLVDSGGQYKYGTTDITRTIPIGNITDEMRRNYGLVLKGFEALSSLRFPKGTCGHHIDAIARQYLWEYGLDYEHGTGHGVGSFLSVHESPPSISKRVVDYALEAGMILSIEPAYYKEGEYGIRIESLVLVEECDDNFLQFKILTQVPVGVLK